MPTYNSHIILFAILLFSLSPACKSKEISASTTTPTPVTKDLSNNTDQKPQETPSLHANNNTTQKRFEPDEGCDAPKELLPQNLQPGQTKQFGAPLVIKEKPMTLPQAIQHLDENNDKNIKLVAKVDKVCSARGCWMTFKDKDVNQIVRVRMKGHSFFVPKNASGATAIAEGTLSKRLIPKELLQHYAKETSGTTELPQKDAFEYVFIANGVELSMPNS